MTIGNISIKNKYIWIVVIVIVVIFAIAILNWIINSSFIEISITNGKSGDYKYNFLSHSSNKNTEVVTNNSLVKQLLPTDSYNVTVQQDYQSFFSVVKTDRFLGNTYIESKLTPENKREFVGNNPGQCMSYVTKVLVTYNCEGLLSNALVHIPATPTLPTYSTTTRGQGPAGYYEGIFETKDGSFALSHIPNSSELGQTHMLNKLGNNFTSVEAINITNLNPSTRYSASKYKDGFIAYNQSFTDIQYFPTPKDQSSNITGVSLDSSYTPISLDTNNNTVITSYNKSNTTYVYFNNSGTVNSTKVDKPYSRVSYCKDNYLCMTNNKMLDIYRINNNQLDYQYSISGVEETVSVDNDLIIANEFGLVKFNIENRSGYLAYSFGSYKYNSISKSTSGNQFVVNVTNPQGNKVALLINPNENNNDNIDKKIAELQKDPNIRTVSIYKNYITIVPNIPASTQPNSQFDQSKVKDINQQINNRINSLGINQKEYTINYTIR